jgi:hypothetical protein
MIQSMKTHINSTGMIVRAHLLQFIAAAAFGLASNAWAATIADNFNDGNDTAPTIAWQHYDPIGDATGGQISLGSWTFPGGNTYRLQTLASPDPGTFGQARIGSLAPSNFTNFYVAVDVLNYDPTTHQVFGVIARVSTPGPGTTTGYLFNWDNGNQGPTSGDMDIVRIDGELPTDLDSNTYYGNDSVHLETNHNYRFVFMGVGGTFRGQVYDLTNAAVPIVDYGVVDPNYDPNGSTHVSGLTGLIVVNNASTMDGPADATFDNFIASDGPLLAENYPLLSISTPVPGTVTVTWPGVGNGASHLLTDSLQSSPSLTSPAWAPVTNGITTNGVENVYTVSPATGTQFFKLVLP